jgi:hypothetical protein
VQTCARARRRKTHSPDPAHGTANVEDSSVFVQPTGNFVAQSGVPLPVDDASTQPGSDGLLLPDGVLVQGVRSYDSDTGQWTAPDAYAGDVHDPMSQQSYMWNNNNSIAYSDLT